LGAVGRLGSAARAGKRWKQRSALSQHWPPPGIERGVVVPGQIRSQVEPPLQDTEHEGPVHVTWHVAPLVHETEPEVPTVRVHEERLQSMLPLVPVVRAQVLLSLQAALHDPWQLP
jgi:hypothetical protein